MFGSTTVASILGAFHKIVAKLEAHASFSAAKAEFHKAEADAHAAEATAATDAAAKIKALL